MIFYVPDEDRIRETQIDYKPTTSPYSTVSGFNRRHCGYLCNMDDNCYNVGVQQVSGGRVNCELFGQLTGGEVYNTETGYVLYTCKVTMLSCVTN